MSYRRPRPPYDWQALIVVLGLAAGLCVIAITGLIDMIVALTH